MFLLCIHPMTRWTLFYVNFAFLWSSSSRSSRQPWPRVFHLQRQVLVWRSPEAAHADPRHSTTGRTPTPNSDGNRDDRIRWVHPSSHNVGLIAGKDLASLPELKLSGVFKCRKKCYNSLSNDNLPKILIEASLSQIFSCKWMGVMNGWWSNTANKNRKPS